MYDFSDLTPERAAANVNEFLETVVGTKRQLALLEASLAVCGFVWPEPAPSPNGDKPASVLG